MEDIRAGSCGKTYREAFQAIRGETFTKSSKASVPSAQIPTMYLNLRGNEGQISLFGGMPEPSWETVTPSRGESSMLSGLEFLREDGEFSSLPITGERPKEPIHTTLTDILEAEVPQKYSLSSRAAMGILTRAMRREKKLPPILWEALIETVSCSKTEKVNQGGAKV